MINSYLKNISILFLSFLIVISGCSTPTTIPVKKDSFKVKTDQSNQIKMSDIYNKLKENVNTNNNKIEIIKSYIHDRYSGGNLIEQIRNISSESGNLSCINQLSSEDSKNFLISEFMISKIDSKYQLNLFLLHERYLTDSEVLNEYESVKLDRSESFNLGVEIKDLPLQLPYSIDVDGSNINLSANGNFYKTPNYSFQEVIAINAFYYNLAFYKMSSTLTIDRKNNDLLISIKNINTSSGFRTSGFNEENNPRILIPSEMSPRPRVNDEIILKIKDVFNDIKITLDKTELTQPLEFSNISVEIPEADKDREYTLKITPPAIQATCTGSVIPKIALDEKYKGNQSIKFPPEGQNVDDTINGTYTLEFYFNDTPNDKIQKQIKVNLKRDIEVSVTSTNGIINGNTFSYILNSGSDPSTKLSIQPSSKKMPYKIKTDVIPSLNDSCNVNDKVLTGDITINTGLGTHIVDISYIDDSGKASTKIDLTDSLNPDPTSNPTSNPTDDPSSNPTDDPSSNPNPSNSSSPNPNESPSNNPSNPPSPSSYPSPSNSASPNPTPTKNCNKLQDKLNEIENNVQNKINEIRGYESVIKYEYLKTSPDLDKVREADIKIHQSQNKIDNLFSNHRNITASNDKCDFKRLFGMSLEAEKEVKDADDFEDPLTFSTQGTKVTNIPYSSFEVVEGGYKPLTLSISRPFMLPNEYIKVTGKMQLKSVSNNSIIAEWDIFENFDSSSPIESKITRIWYGRKNIGVGPDLADIDSYELVLSPIISTNIPKIAKFDVSKPILLVTNKHPEYVRNGIPKAFSDNGYHVLSRHAINFLTEAQKSKYKELFQTYIEASKRVAIYNGFNTNEGSRQRVLKRNYKSLIDSLTSKEKNTNPTFTTTDLNGKNTTTIKVENVITKGTTCFDSSWNKSSILMAVEGISNLSSSKDKWILAGAGIGIRGTRNLTKIDVFVDNPAKKISTGYPVLGKILSNSEIQTFFIQQVFSGFDTLRDGDKDYILNLIPNYESLQNLNG